MHHKQKSKITLLFIAFLSFSVQSEEIGFGYWLGGVNYANSYGFGWELGSGYQISNQWSTEIKYSQNKDSTTNAENGHGYIQVNAINRFNSEKSNSLFWKVGVVGPTKSLSHFNYQAGIGYEFMLKSKSSNYVSSYQFGLDIQHERNDSDRAAGRLLYFNVKFPF